MRKALVESSNFHAPRGGFFLARNRLKRVGDWMDYPTYIAAVSPSRLIFVEWMETDLRKSQEDHVSLTMQSRQGSDVCYCGVASCCYCGMKQNGAERCVR
jgi:hypothetical protein